MNDGPQTACDRPSPQPSLNSRSPFGASSRTPDGVVRLRHRVLLLVAPIVLSACSKGCRRGRPYTPYAIGDESQPPQRATPAVALSAVAVPSTSSSAFGHLIGVANPEDGGALQLDRARIEPPPDARLAVALPADLDGDGIKDLTAWAVGADPLAGRVLFYKGRSPDAVEPPRALAALDPGKIGIPGCSSEARLEQVGPRTVAATVRAVCSSALDGSLKSRWVAVASPAREPALREQVWLGDPPAGENLHVDLDASDQDADGRDDLVVRLILDGAPMGFEPSPPVSAQLRYYDRQVGLSRDPQEPEASFRAAAAVIAGRASKKTDAAEVFPMARELERLHAVVCADEALAIVTPASGQVRCGASRALEDLVAARVRAALTVNDVPRAIAALTRAAFRPATSQRRAELEKAVLKALVLKTPVAQLAAVQPDIDPSSAPAWGPMTFLPNGQLLVRGRQGMVLIDVASGQETPAQGIPSWPAAVTNPDNTMRWLGAFDACDGMALRVRFGAPNEPAFAIPSAVGTGREFVLPILAPAPSRCLPDGVRADMSPTPVAWGPSGLEAWVAGERVLIAPDQNQARLLSSDLAHAQPPHTGSPRSPDGRMFALATPLGALVRNTAGWQLWRPGDREGAHAYAGFRACTAANDGHAIACVRGGRLVLMRDGT